MAFEPWEKEAIKGMPEPTREQIQKAFKKTIERWERTAEDPSYFDEVDCPLCELIGRCELKVCPITIYTGELDCKNTPFYTFSSNRNRENAIAELNFLRKVYIWWIEGEGKKNGWMFIKVNKEEKKEEWVDVTNEILWEKEFSFVASSCNRVSLIGKHNGNRVVVATNSGIIPFCSDVEDSYRVNHDDSGHCIFKKK